MSSKQGEGADPCMCRIKGKAKKIEWKLCMRCVCARQAQHGSHTKSVSELGDGSCSKLLTFTTATAAANVEGTQRTSKESISHKHKLKNEVFS